MLLEFKTKNFKSFEKEANFSMLAVPNIKELDYSVFKEKIKRKVNRVLCSSVIYGHNASGKTNIIEAMDVLRSIVIRGNIKNTEEANYSNPCSSRLELIPNYQLAEPKPVEFKIVFSAEGMKISYELDLSLGTFLDRTAKRKVLRELLTIDEAVVYERQFINNDSHVSIGNLESLSKKIKINSSIIANLESVAQSSLNSEELFLNNGFKSIYSSQLSNLIVDWFVNKLIVVCRVNSLQLNSHLSESSKANVLFIEQGINDAAKIFGLNSNAIGYTAHKENEAAKLYSIINILKHKTENAEIAIDADVFESYGTMRFFTIFPMVAKAIMEGCVLIVDEFDASIHPMALMSIINVFHNDEINKKRAQLIFNTQNPVFLNPNVFRRDEIKFVERGNIEQSVLYSLSDFQSRKHEDYLNNYFIGRYGAIMNIDFTPYFEKILSKGETNNEQS